MGRAMFFSICSPRSTKASGSLSRTWRQTSSERLMPPGSAIPQPRRDVDPVAQQVGAIDHDIAQVNSDPESDEAVGSDLGIALRHTALHGQRAAHGVDDARKLDQDAVAGGLDDAAAMHRDGRIDQLQPYGA